MIPGRARTQVPAQNPRTLRPWPLSLSRVDPQAPRPAGRSQPVRRSRPSQPPPVVLTSIGTGPQIATGALGLNRRADNKSNP